MISAKTDKASNGSHLESFNQRWRSLVNSATSKSFLIVCFDIYSGILFELIPEDVFFVVAMEQHLQGRSIIVTIRTVGLVLGEFNLAFADDGCRFSNTAQKL